MLNLRADSMVSVVCAEVARAAKEGLPLYTQTKSGLFRPMRQVFAVAGHGVVEPRTGFEPATSILG